MKIIIIEDEHLSAMRLARLLKKFDPAIEIEGSFTTNSECIKYFQNGGKPDLIFSDIRIADGLSFDALFHAPESVPVIFTSAYEEYALKAFEANGIGYIMKPVTEQSLAEAMKKFERLLQTSNKTIIRDILSFSNSFHQQYRERFLISWKDSLISVTADDILFFSSNNSQTFIYCSANRKFPFDCSLESLENQLDPTRFFRTSRNAIVNIKAISQIITMSSRKLKIEISEFPDAEITVGKERIGLFKKWLGQ